MTPGKQKTINTGSHSVDVTFPLWFACFCKQVKNIFLTKKGLFIQANTKVCKGRYFPIKKAKTLKNKLRSYSSS